MGERRRQDILGQPAASAEAQKKVRKLLGCQ
jgi:hypothetical protein